MAISKFIFYYKDTIGGKHQFHKSCLPFFKKKIPLTHLQTKKFGPKRRSNIVLKTYIAMFLPTFSFLWQNAVVTLPTAGKYYRENDVLLHFLFESQIRQLLLHILVKTEVRLFPANQSCRTVQLFYILPIHCYDLSQPYQMHNRVCSCSC